MIAGKLLAAMFVLKLVTSVPEQKTNSHKDPVQNLPSGCDEDGCPQEKESHLLQKLELHATTNTTGQDVKAQQRNGCPPTKKCFRQGGNCLKRGNCITGVIVKGCNGRNCDCCIPVPTCPPTMCPASTPCPTLVATTAAPPTSTPCPTPAGDGCDFGVKVGELCIEVSDDVMNWHDAKEACATAHGGGGRLVVLSGYADPWDLVAYITTYYAFSGTQFWVGASKLGDGKTWEWINGVAVSTSFLTGFPWGCGWGLVQPSDDGDCMSMWDNYGYNDAGCDTEQFRYICQFNY